MRFENLVFSGHTLYRKCYGYLAFRRRVDRMTLHSENVCEQDLMFTELLTIVEIELVGMSRFRWNTN